MRLRREDAWINLLAMLDTGADISLFDAELAAALGLASDTTPDYRLTVLGIGGAVRQIDCWRVEVSVLPEDLRLQTSLVIGLVPRLGKSTGNLLGRDFLESLDFGLRHHERRLYLGRPNHSGR